MKGLLGFIFGLGLSLILVSVLGENPIHILQIFYNSVFATQYDLATTLFTMTSLIFTGLSVAVAFHAGLFNIGAEGQLLMGSLGMAISGLLLPNLILPYSFLWALVLGLCLGGFWGFIPGYLKSRWGGHEVIVTMMLNFIAAGIVNYFVIDVFQNREVQTPETIPLTKEFLLSSFTHGIFPRTPVNASFLFAVLFCFLFYVLIYHTRWGFQLRSVGKNPEASKFYGVPYQKIQIQAFVLAGFLAAFVGVNEVLGFSGRLRLGFSSDLGFLGVAVAMMASGHPIGILASSFLFAFLLKGSLDLDLETQTITKDFARVIQALVLLSVIGFTQFPFKLPGFKSGK